MSQYFAIIFGKNMEQTLRQTIDSLRTQSCVPTDIIVVDDGSTDRTGELLTIFKRSLDHASPPTFHSIRLPESSYDLRRIPLLWNVALEYAERREMAGKFFLVGADDDELSPKYAETLLREMEDDFALVISSGEVSGRAFKSAIGISAPEGGGRIYAYPFFKAHVGRFPTSYGYESWVLYKAHQLGFKAKKIFSEDATINHLRPLGSIHGFREWGLSMACAEYLPLYVLLRAGQNLLLNHKIISWRGTLKMTWDYFKARLHPPRDDWAYKKWRTTDPELVKWIRRNQAKQIIRTLTYPVRFAVKKLLA
jgi:glycosyltransferase involved in cell wall biosynthesis